MGVKFLGKWIKDTCPESFGVCELKHLNGYYILVDAFNILYDCIPDELDPNLDIFTHNVSVLVHTLLEDGITPVFVFDGKPPAEKTEILARRKLEKTTAQIKLYEYIQESNELEDGSPEKDTILSEIPELVHRSKRLTICHQSIAKEELTNLNVKWIVAPEEADTLCAYLMEYSHRYIACFSNDMDMFVYGYRLVLRNIDIINKTIEIYDTHVIRTKIEISRIAFKEILILSGTDYNDDESTPFTKTLALYHKYYRLLRRRNTYLSFYDWIKETNPGYIRDEARLIETSKLFNTNNCSFLSQYID